jgi:hypothetical protein
MCLLLDGAGRIKLAKLAFLVFSKPLACGSFEPRLSNLAAICAPREVAISRNSCES